MNYGVVDRSSGRVRIFRQQWQKWDDSSEDCGWFWVISR